MILKRVRVWGVKDGRRVFADQQGPVLVLDPEVQVIREAEDIEAAASDYLDTFIDVWTGEWASDAELQELADEWNRSPKREPPTLSSVESLRRVYDIATMRASEEEEFVSHNQGPPWDWESVVESLEELKDGKKQFMFDSGQPPKDFLLCRDCLKPSRWIWHEYFPGLECGSAGWVAICEDCQTWHREKTCIIS